VYGVCVQHVNTAFGFFPNPLDLLIFFSNPPDERVGVCMQRVNAVCEYLFLEGQRTVCDWKQLGET